MPKISQNFPKSPKISNIAQKSSQYFDSTNLSKILNFNFNIQLIDLLIEPQVVAHLIFQKSYWIKNQFISHPYSTSSCFSFFHKSGSSTFTPAGALICFTNPPFHTSKCEYQSHLYVGAITIETFLIIRKMDGGEE